MADPSINSLSMNSTLKNLLRLLSFEYLTLDRDAIVLDCSLPDFENKFEQVSIGKPLSLDFPDIPDIKIILGELLAGTRDSYRTSIILDKSNSPQTSLHLDFHFWVDRDGEIPADRVLVCIEELTTKRVLEQKILKKSNEASLLAMAWSASQAYLDQIINSMADALIVTDYSGTIKKLNPATQTLFGYDESELLDRNISFIFPEGFDFSLFATSKTTDYSDLDAQNRNLEISCSTKSGDEVIVDLSRAKIPTDIKDLPDFVYLGKDITNRVKAEIKLIQSLEKEKEINELKSRFVAMTSHELRTPLNTILFASELLRDVNPEESEELLEAIDFNVKRLTELVDYVSIVGKTELETVELKKTTLDLVEFCRGLTYEIQLSQGNDSVLKFSSASKKMSANVDRKILRHTIKSLLSNAVKYASKKGRVSLKLTREEHEIVFLVKTQGNALPIGDRQKLLESCYSSGSLSEIPETGLGFAIAQKYARLQGGRVEVEDNARKGTVFKVSIPDSN